MGRIPIETPPGQVSYYAAETQQKLKEPEFFLEKSKDAFAEIEEEEKNGKSKDAFASPELPVLVFIHGESWSWGSAR